MIYILCYSLSGEKGFSVFLQPFSARVTDRKNSFISMIPKL